MKYEKFWEVAVSNIYVTLAFTWCIRIYLMFDHTGQQIVILTTIWWWQRSGSD
jgi:hypothetical protein